MSSSVIALFTTAFLVRYQPRYSFSFLESKTRVVLLWRENKLPYFVGIFRDKNFVPNKAGNNIQFLRIYTCKTVLVSIEIKNIECDLLLCTIADKYLRCPMCHQQSGICETCTCDGIINNIGSVTVRKRHYGFNHILFF